MQTPKANGRGSRWWYALLLLPFVAMFWVSSYDRLEPSWGGVPFFYWYWLSGVPRDARQASRPWVAGDLIGLPRRV